MSCKHFFSGGLKGFSLLNQFGVAIHGYGNHQWTSPEGPQAVADWLGVPCTLQRTEVTEVTVTLFGSGQETTHVRWRV